MERSQTGALCDALHGVDEPIKRIRRVLLIIRYDQSFVTKKDMQSIQRSHVRSDPYCGRVATPQKYDTSNQHQNHDFGTLKTLSNNQIIE